MKKLIYGMMLFGDGAAVEGFGFWDGMYYLKRERERDVT